MSNVKKVVKKTVAISASEQTPVQTPDQVPVAVTKADFDDLKKELTEIKAMIKDFKKNLKGLVEIQQRLVHERLGVPVPASPKEYGEEQTAKVAKINIVSIDDDRIRVSGNTFDFKTAIKEAGQAKWEQGTKSWSLPADCLDQLIKNLEAVNLVNGTDFSVPALTDKAGGGEDKKSESDDDGWFG